MTPPRVRFAPSPTGYLHVGGARTALYNWLVARSHPDGVFALRIEDTDRDRSSAAMVDAILEGMRWLGLDWDEGPVHQADGVEGHRARALELLEAGRAYRDFTDPEELARIREEEPDRAVRWPREQWERLDPEEAELRTARGEHHAIRFRVPSGETTWEDRIHGTVRFRNEDLEDLVLLRTDGTPTYNLAVVADDAAMGINLVIRGDDHISNTPKQILLYEALGLPVPEFAHAPMILGPDGKRLSKRHGAASVGEFEARGILPEAMTNFLALLGWSPGDDRELFGPTELVEAFSLDRVGTKAAVFDVEKLEWMNGRYMEARDPSTLVEPVLEALGADRERAMEAASAQDPDGDARRRVLQLVSLLASRARTVTDLADALRIYLFDEVVPEEKAAAKHWYRKPEMV
ncbi:MAG: glutamate--tRNA ligase, partial [Gemmatimonadales bacterium]